MELNSVNSTQGTAVMMSPPQAIPARPASPQGTQFGTLLQGPGGKREMKLYTPTKLTPLQQEAVTRAKKYAMEQSIKSVLLKQTLIHQQQMSQLQTLGTGPLGTLGGGAQVTDQVWTKLGTIYVGNINFDVTEETLKQAFSPFGPIKKISLSWDAIANKHRGYSFVEYDVPEAAFLALDQMNGVLLSSRNIKVGRPSNMPQALPIIEKLMDDAKPYNRIYVASIHTDLSETDIQSVFEAFGKIKSCKLAQDMVRPGKHRGYGYIEFETAQGAQDAVVSMNLFNLGGQFLRVGKAVTPPNTHQVASFVAPMPTAAAVAAATATARITAMDALSGVGGFGIGPPGVAILPQLSAPGIVTPASLSVPLTGAGSRLGSMPLAPGMPPPSVVVPTVASLPQQTAAAATAAATAAAGKHGEDDFSIASQENMQISGTEARHMVMQKLMSRQSATRVMVLKNMVSAEDVDDDLESEVIDECSTYGNVLRVIIYQEKQSEDEYAETIVKIFVEFKEPSDVEKAVKSLNGRYFAGRQIRAEPFDQALFEANELSG